MFKVVLFTIMSVLLSGCLHSETPQFSDTDEGVYKPIPDRAGIVTRNGILRVNLKEGTKNTFESSLADNIIFWRAEKDKDNAGYHSLIVQFTLKKTGLTYYGSLSRDEQRAATYQSKNGPARFKSHRFFLKKLKPKAKKRFSHSIDSLGIRKKLGTFEFQDEALQIYNIDYFKSYLHKVEGAENKRQNGEWYDETDLPIKVKIFDDDTFVFDLDDENSNAIFTEMAAQFEAGGNATQSREYIIGENAHWFIAKAAIPPACLKTGGVMNLSQLGYTIGNGGIFEVFMEDNRCVIRAFTGAKISLGIGNVEVSSCSKTRCRFEARTNCSAVSLILRDQCTKHPPATISGYIEVNENNTVRGVTLD